LSFLFGIVQNTFLLSRDTLYFSDSNPYPFSVEIDREQGFEAFNVKVTGVDNQVTIFSPYKFDFSTSNPLINPPQYIGGAYTCKANPSNGLSSIANMGQCCASSGWRDISIVNYHCYRYETQMPKYIRFKYGNEIIGEFDPSVTSTYSFDVSKYLSQNCASAFVVERKGLYGELSSECITTFTAESDLSSGSIYLGLGSIFKGSLQTCYDGKMNQDETSIDFGGVCGTDYCVLRNTTCEKHCSGVNAITGECSKASGDCDWTTIENAFECGYVAPELEVPVEVQEPVTPTEETDGIIIPSEERKDGVIAADGIWWYVLGASASVLAIVLLIGIVMNLKKKR
jgi:hypothetical protein